VLIVESCLSSSVASTKETISLGGAFTDEKIPLGIRLSEGGYQSFHAAHTAGTKALTQLLADIMKEEKNSA